MVIGDLKKMSPRWIVGVSMLGYGCSMAVGIGLAIPILDEEMAYYTGVGDEDIMVPVRDYSFTETEPLAEVSYAELKRGVIKIRGKDVPTVPLSSYVRALEIAETLKKWIKEGKFFISQPQELLPGALDKSSTGV
jgi:uncharacterized protein (DUF39 family)